ncbi:MAG: LysR substrate-binding domain-containing protein [Pseudolabrys sp.]
MSVSAFSKKLGPQSNKIEHAELIGRRAARGEAGSITLGYVLSAACKGVIAAALIHFRKTHRKFWFMCAMSRRRRCSGPSSTALSMSESCECHEDILRELGGFIIDREPFRLVLPEGHPLAKRQQIPASAIAKEPLIAAPLEMEPGFWGNLVSVLGSSTPFISSELRRTLSQCCPLVAAGVGVGVVSRSLSRISLPGIVYRDIIGSARQAEHAFIYRRNEASPVVSAFLKSLRHDFWTRRG